MAHLTIIHHDTEAYIKEKLRHEPDEAYKTRMKAVRLALSGKKRYEISDQLAVDEKSVTTWITKYNEGGLKALETNKGGRPEGNPKWDTAIFDALVKAIEDTKGYWSIPRMQEWIEKNHKQKIPEQTVWYHLDKLGYSYKGARPHPMQGNKEAQGAFKKGDSLRMWRR